MVRTDRCILEREQAWIDATPERRLFNGSKIAGRPAKEACRVYFFCAKSGKCGSYPCAGDAAQELFGDSDKLYLIHKAARRRARSGGFYWSYRKSDSIETIRSDRRERKKKQEQKLPLSVFGFNAEGRLIAEFRTAKEAAEAYGVLPGSITAALNQESYRTAAGLTWSRLRVPKAIRCKKKKPVIQFRGEEVVARWSSAREAASELGQAGINHKGISGAATGYTKTHGGFRWAFAKT
jgi:hypothetical protein